MKAFRVFSFCFRSIVSSVAMLLMVTLSACHESSTRNYSAVASGAPGVQRGQGHSDASLGAESGTPVSSGSSARPVQVAENRQNDASDTGHIYTSAPVLTPTSSNTATRIYSESNPGSTNEVNPVRTPVPPGKDHISAAPQDEAMSDKDRELAHRIREQMLHDPAVAQIGPEVKLVVDNGKVKLVGNVNSEKEKSALKNFVQNSDGVAAVDDQVEVKPSAQ
jgi:osmotically-inducible protein OsmY